VDVDWNGSNYLVMVEISEASVRAELDSLIFNDRQLAQRVRLLEKMIDTANTPLWKRILFRIDGWPRWTVVADCQAWRPWHRWYRS